MTLNIRLLTLVMTIACVSLLPPRVSAQGFGPREENTALNGTRLTYYPRPSAEQCQADCAQNGQCQGFTWIKAGTYNPADAAMCYLLSAVTGGTAAAGHISAVKGAGGGTGGSGPVITWGDNPVAGHRGENGKRFTYSCPANGTPANVWGTDSYTDDSSVCTAAVHAGVITFALGGTVTVEVRSGQDHFTGSKRNGVESSNWDRHPGSFVFVR
jgi:hypothetical protein